MTDKQLHRRTRPHQLAGEQRIAAREARERVDRARAVMRGEVVKVGRVR